MELRNKMIVRELKLKLNIKQEQQLNDWLWYLTGVYNWAIRKIELNAKDKIYFSKFDMQNCIANHSKKMSMPSHTIQGIIIQAYMTWQRCFKKKGGKPKLKLIGNKLMSIPFPDMVPLSRVDKQTIRMPGLGQLRYFKQELPKGKIKNGRIIKRASGWYLQLTIDAIHKFKVKNTNEKVGIDTGFKHLAVFSNGVKYNNPRYYIKLQKRLAQAQRGRDKKLVARLHEKIKNQRKDNNHKIAREIVENYNEIYITNDNLRNQAKKLGKSVNDAGISQLRNFILYKGNNHNREVKLVDSKYTTMTCSTCGSLTGPKGWNELAVRYWECSACGAVHDRDINSAKVVLNTGAGIALKEVSNVFN